MTRCEIWWDVGRRYYTLCPFNDQHAIYIAGVSKPVNVFARLIRGLVLYTYPALSATQHSNAVDWQYTVRHSN